MAQKTGGGKMRMAIFITKNGENIAVCPTAVYLEERPESGHLRLCEYGAAPVSYWEIIGTFGKECDELNAALKG